MIPRGSEALFVLQHLRDEAHRFAVTYHRQTREKRALRSPLDDVPGVGPARKKALLKRFGSVARLRRAEVEQIAETPGIGPELAAAIHDRLHEAEPAARSAVGGRGPAARPEGQRMTTEAAPSPATDEATAGAPASC